MDSQRFMMTWWHDDIKFFLSQHPEQCNALLLSYSWDQADQYIHPSVHVSVITQPHEITQTSTSQCPCQCITAQPKISMSRPSPAVYSCIPMSGLRAHTALTRTPAPGTRGVTRGGVWVETLQQCPLQTPSSHNKQQQATTTTVTWHVRLWRLVLKPVRVTK